MVTQDLQLGKQLCFFCVLDKQIELLGDKQDLVQSNLTCKLSFKFAVQNAKPETPKQTIESENIFLR